MTPITRRRDNRLCLVLALCAGPAVAAELSLPAGAVQSFATVQDPGAYALPTGPWANGRVPVDRVEGRVEVAAWHIPGNTATPFQLVQPLRDAFVADGYEVLLDCRARTCGSFDFRFATLVLPAPEMFVNLTDFHFVSARAPDGGAVSILASRDSRQGYLQVIRAGSAAGAAMPAPAARQTAQEPPPTPADGGDIAARLETQGHVVLRDLVFTSGSTSLGEGPVASLDAIAAYLAANPARQVLFVGHTDATGSLEANRTVSQRRAEAAVTYLRTRHGIPAAQLGAEGAGYLSPVASNLTPEGREANRRVEAVLISTE
ncbi:OmpA family protein [Maliponia aquimaris]|uniref:Outer membrane porin F n=1 Tax=Maliponia aquimaris TaxID=1673631 RepID=A0A238KD63_9RHOB|nr:OmpA family protein [Maliponia aquimaris]SMX40723.1 Outer membrane porin F precursor [Maliponia aquimaris]